MIHTTRLSRTFRRKKEVVEAVKDVDLDIAPGELVAFLGPNGAGKSTTLRMLTSLLTPTSGTARVCGFDVREQPTEVRRRIGYIGQGNGAGHSHRVRDELHNQGRFYGLPKGEYVPRAADLITALELDGLEARTVSTLSGGQRRRLDVAMGLMNHPRLLFLDEPSTGMDPHGRANLWQHILGMRERYGMTLVLTTHYLEEADSMSERVVVIDHGRVIADSTAARLKREHAADVITVTIAGGRADDAVRHVREALGGPGTVAPATTATAADDGQPVGHSVRVELDHGPERLPRLLSALAASGTEVASAELARASLDDVFLNLTGRSLREEGEAA